jgi:hypothetical protein
MSAPSAPASRAQAVNSTESAVQFEPVPAMTWIARPPAAADSRERRIAVSIARFFSSFESVGDSPVVPHCAEEESGKDGRVGVGGEEVGVGGGGGGVSGFRDGREKNPRYGGRERFFALLSNQTR